MRLSSAGGGASAARPRLKRPAQRPIFAESAPDSAPAAPASAARLAWALALLPDAALVVDESGVVLAANDGAERMFGHDAAELAGRPVQLLLPGTGSLDALLPAHDAPAGPVKLEGRRSTGVPVAVEASARRVDTEDGVRVLCTLRELARDELAGEARRYFDAAFDDAPIGMALFNPDGEYVRVNAALCGILDRSAGELLGRRDQELTHPDDRQADVDAAWEILDGRRSTHQCEKRFVRPDGSVVWTLANLTFLRDGAGRALSWVGQFQDVTARREAEQALRRERDVSAAVLASMQEGFALSRDGVILDVNDALCRLTGFAREQLVGSRAPWPFWPEEQHEALMALRERLLRQGSGELEITLARRDGTAFDASVTFTRAAEPGRHPLRLRPDDPRHQRAEAPRAGPRAPGDAGLAHRAPQPRRVPPAAGRGGGPGRSHRVALEPGAAGPRPLQAHQRRPRAPGRRSRARRGRRAAASRQPARRPRGALGRRGVRLAAARQRR